MAALNVRVFVAAAAVTVLAVAPFTVDGALYTLVWVPVAVVSSLGAVIAAFVAQRAGYFFLKLFWRYVLRRVVGHLVALYITLHPDLTNAQVRQLKRRALVVLRAYSNHLRSWKFAVGVIGFVSAWTAMVLLLIWVGALSIVFTVLRFIGELVLRTAAGRVLHEATLRVTRHYGNMIRARFMKFSASYHRANMRALRSLSRRYRILHRDSEREQTP